MTARWWLLHIAKDSKKRGVIGSDEEGQKTLVPSFTRSRNLLDEKLSG
jgi:hypothetical protein